MQTQTINLRRGAFGQPSVPFLLSRRAHLLTTPKGRWYFLRNRALSEGDAAPAGAYGQCHNSADLLSLSTQLVCGMSHIEYRRFNRRYFTNCPHKPATGSFVCGYDYQLN